MPGDARKKERLGGVSGGKEKNLIMHEVGGGEGVRGGEALPRWGLMHRKQGRRRMLGKAWKRSLDSEGACPSMCVMRRCWSGESTAWTLRLEEVATLNKAKGPAGERRSERERARISDRRYG